jgi:DNA polymerase-3 subunit alpha
VLANLDRAIAAGQASYKAKARGQASLFGGEEADNGQFSPTTLTGPVMDQSELLANEKEAIGIYLSSHPLQNAIGTRLPDGHTEIMRLADKAAGTSVRIICAIKGIRRIQTRQNRTMAVVDLEDLTGRIEMVMYPEVFDDFGSDLQSDQIVTVVARTDYRNDQLQLICERVLTEIESVAEPAPIRTIVLSPPRSADFWEDVEVLQRLDAILCDHDGPDEIVLQIYSGGVTRRIRSRKHMVDWDEELAGLVSAEIGAENITVLNGDDSAPLETVLTGQEAVLQ